MALIDCPECSGQVSDKAPTCPHCGIPIAGALPPPVLDPDTAKATAFEPAGPSDTAAEVVEPEPPDAGPPIPAAVAPPPDAEPAESDADPGEPSLPVEGHIFVSYKSEDRNRARLIAEALERRGWPVWWDHEIQAGQAFRRVIAQALEDAVCMVVLWSELSIESEWVQEEASQAKLRSILVPALLDDVSPPLGFGQTQAASLVGWNGAPDDPVLDGLLRGVCSQLGITAIPALLDDEEWEAVVESERAMRAKAAAAQATEERATAAAALDAAERAGAERTAAAVAGEFEAEADAARREAEANAAAERATNAAEKREAEMARELAAEHAADLRAVVARRAEKEAEAELAEESAQRTRTAARATAAARSDPKRWAASGVGATEPAAKASWFRFPREGVATLFGGVLVAISVYVPWTFGDENALEYSLNFLLDFEDLEGNDLGLLLLAVGGLGAVLALFRIPRWITVILGAVAVTVAVWFLVQLVRTLGGDDTAEQFFELARFGPVVTIAGGLLMLSGR